MPRDARIDYPGALHHVIVRGIEGKRIFKGKQDKEELYTRARKVFDKSSMQIYAWCIMSNHFHLVIQSGKTALSEFMRPLLTGYAVNYNKRRKRKGYLFQNRYKSVLCDKDEYLLPLIRYVHLNPVKARMIKFSQLKTYQWTGHKELMNSGEGGLINGDEVLGYFGTTKGKARRGYEEFVKNGLSSREDFAGGGLIRSMGGPGQVSRTGGDERQRYDERILGRGDFIERALSEMRKEEGPRPFKDFEELLEKTSIFYKIDKERIIQLKTKDVRAARSVLIFLGTRYLGRSATEIGALLGITQSAASKAKDRGMEIAGKEGLLDKL